MKDYLTSSNSNTTQDQICGTFLIVKPRISRESLKECTLVFLKRASYMSLKKKKSVQSSFCVYTEL